jgi:hypothetical protein
MRLFDCEACSADIFADDVFKVIPLTDAPGFLALVFRCPTCDQVGRASSTMDEWAEVRNVRTRENSKHNELVAAFAADLEVFDTVELLQSYWASLRRPPLFEATMGKCKCQTCRNKLRASNE